ncbi:FAD-dependent oxidoreductase [Kineococcus sp. SYSU DK006]|uniref:FAD-dependent oxidoreductase n=1 Tax=Kineococcus sp. SYSU DK006 TaxID=3383127 RepID=UPI003D7DC51F
MSRVVRVVVVGGGYAGVMSANRLSGRRVGQARVQVALVDPGARFTERIRLHQVAAGTRASAGVAWAHVLHPDVERVQDRVVGIDAAARSVATGRGGPLGYDHLVYAVGSGEVPTALSSVTSPSAAAATREEISGLAPGASVTVVGAGATGVEVACAVALARADLEVGLVTASPLTTPLRRPAVAGRLRRLGIGVEVGVVDPVTGVVSTAGGRRAAASATIWTAGLAVPRLAAASGLPTTGDGRLVVDATLTVRGHERVVAAGDAAAVDDPTAAHLRMSCAAAIPLGAHAADTVLARIRGAAAPRVDVGFLLQCLDLGGGHGHAQVVRPDDGDRWGARAGVGGHLGGAVKERVCAMTLAWLAREARRPGSYRWPRGPRPSAPGAGRAEDGARRLLG